MLSFCNFALPFCRSMRQRRMVPRYHPPTDTRTSFSASLRQEVLPPPPNRHKESGQENRRTQETRKRRMPARKEAGTQTALNPEVFNPAFHGSDEICQRRAAVSACKTTYRSNQKQTYAYLGEKTVGVGEEVENHRTSRHVAVSQAPR